MKDCGRISLFKRLADSDLDLRGLLLVMLVGCWLGGILLNSWLLLSQVGLFIAAVLSLGASCLFWRKPLVRTASLALFCLCLGAWRFLAVSPVGDTHAISAFINSKTIEVQGSIVAEPVLESNSTLLTVRVQSVSLDYGQSWQGADGEISVQTPDATFDDPYAPSYGDTVQLTGDLTAPSTYSTPEILASMVFPSLFITAQDGNPVLVALYQVRTRLADILLQTLPQPFAALLIAIFLSLRTPALKPLIHAFSVTGTVHLIAPSGFKVTLLAGSISRNTGWLLPKRGAQNWLLLPAQRRRGNWKRWLHTLLVILCVAAYTVLSGGGPAAVRAGIMGILLVLAPRLERTYNVYTALALTALVMSMVDPFVLWDTGFQLSFFGTLGILLLTPFFQRLFPRFLIHLPLGQQVAEMVAVTLAASIGTLPIFALSFNTISFVAPVANLLSVPLLSPLLGLGALICLSGLVSLQLALICGWIAWPVLWFVITAISLCAHLPAAYLQVDQVPSILAWIYYASLALIVTLLVTRLQVTTSNEHPRTVPLLSHRTKSVLQCGLALLTILATGAVARAAQPDGRMTIALLTTGNPAQGEALFLRTPDGQTALIDEGADSTTLAQILDPRLPFWQRTLTLVILSDTSAENLAGLQDIITRYQIGRVVDAGMLHPSVAYARWRSTLDARNLPYTQARQGALISLGDQVSLQVLWPLTELHKSGGEIHDNALVLRLQAPGLSMLLLNSTSLSAYALQKLPTSIAPGSLQAEIVQITGEQGKSFPTALSPVLMLAHPSLLILTDIPAGKSKTQSGVSWPAPPAGPWQVEQSDQMGQLELSSDEHGWRLILSNS